VTEKLPELETNIFDLMFLDSVGNRFEKRSRTESNQGKQRLFGWCWLVCLLFAYMLERGQSSPLLCNLRKLHNHQGFWKTVNEVAENWQSQALILNTSVAITTELYEQIGTPRLNFQAYAYLKLKLHTVTMMLFITFYMW